MTQALSAENYIYEGVWTNWGQNLGSRLTLTLNAKNASILSPALAILISIAGSQLWRLIQFVLHQIRATSQPRPMMYHQVQVTLRNSPTDLDTLWRLVRIGIAWRRVLPLLILLSWSLLHFSTVVAFGLFSSLLLESNDEVLARSPWCGTLNNTYLRTVYDANSPDPDRAQLRTEYVEYLSSRYAAIQQHVDLCSRNNSNTCVVNTDRLNKLNWTSEHVANGCPFNRSVCYPDAGMVVLDTGFLSSFSDLGFNGVKEDRVSVRMLAKCAPLDNARYSSMWQNVSTSDGLRQVAEASYGKSVDDNGNVTYRLWRKPLDCEQRLTVAPYVLTSYFADPLVSVQDGGSTFDPIPDLQSPQADLSLMLLAYNDAYLDAVSDPWFWAQQVTTDAAGFCARSNRTLFVRERPLTGLGCTQQWQICNTDKQAADSDSCTPLSSFSQTVGLLQAPTTSISLGARQEAIVQQVLNAAEKATFYYLMRTLPQVGSLPLRARSRIDAASDAVSTGLPPNQWQTETEYWMELILAYMQQNSIDLATGQFAASTAYVNVTTPSKDHADALQDATYWLCQNQIIHSQTYRNFNVCALLVTSILCVIIIFVGLSLEDCVTCYRKRRSRQFGTSSKAKQDMWVADSDLHLLRTVDELKNGTNWTLSGNGIPRTHARYEADIKDLTVNGHVIEERGDVVMSAMRSASCQQCVGHQKSLVGHQDSGRFEFWQTPLSQSLGKFGTSSSGSSQENPDLHFHNSVDGDTDADVFKFNPYISIQQQNSHLANVLPFSNSIPRSTDLADQSHPVDAEQRPQPTQASLSSRIEYPAMIVHESDVSRPKSSRQLRRAKGNVDLSS